MVQRTAPVDCRTLRRLDRTNYAILRGLQFLHLHRLNDDNP